MSARKYQNQMSPEVRPKASSSQNYLEMFTNICRSNMHSCFSPKRPKEEDLLPAVNIANTESILLPYETHKKR